MIPIRPERKLMCPLCNEKPVIIACCTPCWIRTNNGYEMTTEDKARLALFELALTALERRTFDELKPRWARG